MDAATRPSTRRMAFAIDVEASPDEAFALISDIERHMDALKARLNAGAPTTS